MKLICSDCIDYMKSMDENSVDIVITSPPYNRNIAYSKYKDNLPRNEYLEWTKKWTKEVLRILKEDGSFFLNAGSTCVDPWISIDVANTIRDYFILQNKIVWAKSIVIDDKSSGHFKPVTSQRFINNFYEDIYHFTIDGNVKLDRLSIGCPYIHKYNVERWAGVKKDLRCRGNIWYIPYETIHGTDEKNNHPAIFPGQLVRNCLLLHGIDKIKLVLDPFCGIGTTNKICEEYNIESIGIDIDQSYLDSI